MKPELYDSGQLYWRQVDIISPDKVRGFSLSLIGAGGIGSPTALVLAKMGVKNFRIYDPDKVELHNLPNQLYSNEQVGMFKAEAIAKHIEAFGEEPKISTFNRVFEATDRKTSVIISGVDSMKSRKEIWEIVKNSQTKLSIDGRMGAEVLNLYALDPSNPLHIE
jgi:molybdopterin/thiamine biosynthesis adenylyltransferase